MLTYFTLSLDPETFKVTNSGAILLLIETLNFRAIKSWFILYLQMYVLD